MKTITHTVTTATGESYDAEIILPRPHRAGTTRTIIALSDAPTTDIARALLPCDPDNPTMTVAGTPVATTTALLYEDGTPRGHFLLGNQSNNVYFINIDDIDVLPRTHTCDPDDDNVVTVNLDELPVIHDLVMSFTHKVVDTLRDSSKLPHDVVEGVSPAIATHLHRLASNHISVADLAKQLHYIVTAAHWRTLATYLYVEALHNDACSNGQGAWREHIDAIYDYAKKYELGISDFDNRHPEYVTGVVAAHVLDEALRPVESAITRTESTPAHTIAALDAITTPGAGIDPDLLTTAAKMAMRPRID